MKSKYLCPMCGHALELNLVNSSGLQELSLFCESSGCDEIRSKIRIAVLDHEHLAYLKLVEKIKAGTDTQTESK